MKVKGVVIFLSLTLLFLLPSILSAYSIDIKFNIKIVNTAQATNTKLNLKALLITRLADFYSSPYNQQAAESIMRDWGIPFDVVTTSSVTASTFWDSTNQINKYQFVVYTGGTAIQDQGSDSSTVKNAINNAITNGTNFMFVGPAVNSYGHPYFGFNSFSDCPVNPNGGGTCTTTSFKMSVNKTFTGILRGESTWTSGTIETASNFPNVAILEASPANPSSGTVFMSYSVTGASFASAVYDKNTSGALVWWWSGVEGSFQFYRDGWQDVFTNQLYVSSSNQWAFYNPMVDLFYYALSNITKYDVRILPWATGGSAEIIRAADHETICTYTDCVAAVAAEVSGMTSRGLVGEVNVNLNGWSNSLATTVSLGAPSGATAFPCNTAYSYNGQFAAGKNNFFGLCAQLDNKTSTTQTLKTNIVGSSITQTINFADGNTSEIADLRVLVNTTATPSWTVALKDDTGATIYTSGAQTTNLASATWVDLVPNARGTISSYVNTLQGNINLVLTVTSGTVTWWNASSTTADYVLLGRSSWDIVYVATNGFSNNNKDFTNSVPLVPDSIRMANGVLYPQQNATVYTGSPGSFHPADIVGENNAGAPTSVYFEYFFNSSVWTNYGSGFISNAKSLYNSGWVIETNGWTHAKIATAGNDNDFTYGNGTVMGSVNITARIGDIVTYLNNQLGSGFYYPYYAFGTGANSYYPAMSKLVSNSFKNFTFAQLATEQSTILGYDDAGFYRTTATGLYDAGQGDKPTVPPPTYFFNYNQTREELGVTEIHSDSNYPWNDYVVAQNLGWNQNYDLSSTWFCGTTVRCYNFWNDTINFLTNVGSFQWDSSVGNITLTGNFGTSAQINATKWSNPLVFRLPESFQSLGLNAVHDNRSSGSLTNSTNSYRYYRVNVAKGQTNLQIQYSTSQVSVTINTSPATIINSLTVDSLTYTGPQTFTWYVNSVHNIVGNTPKNVSFPTQYVWSQWSDFKQRTHNITISGGSTFTATYVKQFLVPANVVYYVPFNITNTQSSAITVGTQIRVMMNWNTYGKYLNSTQLQNVVFFDNQGTTMNAWNENASNSAVTNGVAWFKTTQQVAANNGITTFYVGFYKNNTNNFAISGDWGEAPQIPGTYGKFDNGLQVFNSGYWNFSGSSLPSTWSGTATVNNGLSVSFNHYANTTTTYGLNATQIEDIRGNMGTGVVGAANFMGYIGSPTSSNIGAGMTGAGFCTQSSATCLSGGRAAGITTRTGQGHTILNDANGTGTNIYSTYFKASNFVGASVNYGTQYTTASGTNPTAKEPLAAANTQGSTAPAIAITWVRLRTYPPNGVNPGATFGSVQTTLVSFSIKLSLGGNGGTQATFTLSGGLVSPTTVASDGATHTSFTALSGNTTTITPPADASIRYRFNSTFGPNPGTFIAANTTYILTVYEQISEQHKYTVTYGGSPVAPVITTTYEGATNSSTSLTNSLASIWMDYNKPWNITNPTSDSTSTEQWIASVNTTGTATSGAIVTTPYSHQYAVSFVAGSNGAINPTGTNVFENATGITVTGTPNANYKFNTWNATSVSITFANVNSATTTATIGASGTITANFALSGFTLTFQSCSGCSAVLTLNGAQTTVTTTSQFDSGSNLQITAAGQQHTWVAPGENIYLNDIIGQGVIDSSQLLTNSSISGLTVTASQVSFTCSSCDIKLFIPNSDGKAPYDFKSNSVDVWLPSQWNAPEFLAKGAGPLQQVFINTVLPQSGSGACCISGANTTSTSNFIPVTNSTSSSSIDTSQGVQSNSVLNFVGLIVVCLVVAGGVFAFSRRPKRVDKVLSNRKSSYTYNSKYKDKEKYNRRDDWDE